LLILVKQHLRDPSESEKLVGSLQECFASLVRVVAVEIIEAGEEREDECEDEREKERVTSPLCPAPLSDTNMMGGGSSVDAPAANASDVHINSNVPTHASTLSDTSNSSDRNDASDDDEAAEESLVLDEHSTLEGIVASNNSDDKRDPIALTQIRPLR